MSRRERPAPLGHVLALILAGFFGHTARAQTRLPEPVPVSFHTLDGRDVRGEIRGWDALGFDGTFGRIEWKQLDAAEAWHVHAGIIGGGVLRGVLQTLGPRRSRGLRAGGSTGVNVGKMGNEANGAAMPPGVPSMRRFFSRTSDLTGVIQSASTAQRRNSR